LYNLNMTRSIGDILKRARERKRLTLGDVYKDIKIHPTYVKALEADDYSVFSGKVHSKGFLKIYAEYLELSVEDILALWRREYEHEFDIKEKKQLLPKRLVDPPKVLITPSFVVSVVAVVSVVVFFVYLYYQYRHFTGAPNLKINYPPDNLVTNIDILDITGKTDLDSEVYVNSQKILLNPDGTFAESVRLKEGLNTISIKSTNRYARQSEFIRTIIYRPDKKPDVPPVPETTQATEVQEH